MNISPRQLTFAREYRGYTQKELSSRIVGLSQSNLSKFEKGIGSLSDEVLKRIIEYLGFPEGFYALSIYNNVENAHYRRKAGMSKRTKDDIDKSNKLIGYIVDQMAESIEFPTFTLKTIDLEDDYSPNMQLSLLEGTWAFIKDQSKIFVTYLKGMVLSLWNKSMVRRILTECPSLLIRAYQ